MLRSFRKFNFKFSKLLNQKATHKPSAQHVLDEEYYKKNRGYSIHDDTRRWKKSEDIKEADIILLGVSRTSKTPTSIYLANRGFKTLNIPLVLEQNIPKILEKSLNVCAVGLFADAQRLAEVRKSRGQ